MNEIMIFFCSGLAGGLKKLREMSLDDLLNLGSQTNPSGFSTQAPLPLTGFIYNSNIVQNMPPVGIVYIRFYVCVIFYALLAKLPNYPISN